MAAKEAILDMLGFGCPSCAYAVERLGKKIAGIQAIRVDLAKHEIRVSYDGDDTVLNEVCNIVGRIGHDAKVRPGDAVPDEENFTPEKGPPEVPKNPGREESSRACVI